MVGHRPGPVRQGQAVGHGIVFPRIAGYQAAFAAMGVAGPNVIGRDRDSRHAF
jgi:hypothetical protein